MSNLKRITSRIYKILNIKTKKRVVLITPPSFTSPIYYHTTSEFFSIPASLVPIVPYLHLGVAYIAASLEEEGFDVRVVDLTFTRQQQFNVYEVKNAIINLEPDVVGISSYTSTIPIVYKLTKALKEEEETTPIVVGGAHVSALPQRTLEECPAIDAVIVGEGELVFPDFLKLFFGKGICGEIANLKGVMFRYEDKLLGDPNPVYIENLDSLPFPARHLFNLNRYKIFSYLHSPKRPPVTQIITSRGCPHSCLFCTRINNGYQFRARTPKNVVLELMQLKEYGFNEVQIVDDNFTENRQRVLGICRAIKDEGLNMSFSLPNGVRVDSVDDELLSIMYDTGFYSISFGAESGDDKVLKINRKGTTVEQTKKAIRAAKKIGYFVKMFTVVGLPGSSVESEEKTLQLKKESGADYNLTSICTPYPGSPLWDMIEDSLHGVPWERYNEADILNPIYIPEGMSASQLTRFLPIQQV